MAHDYVYKSTAADSWYRSLEVSNVWKTEFSKMPLLDPPKRCVLYINIARIFIEIFLSFYRNISTYFRPPEEGRETWVLSLKGWISTLWSTLVQFLVLLNYGDWATRPCELGCVSFSYRPAVVKPDAAYF